MVKIIFLLLISISSLITSDHTSYYSTSSFLSFDQKISSLGHFLYHGNFKRNALPPSLSAFWTSEFSDELDFTDMTSNQTRFTRNANPLSDYSAKLSTVARISHGISLLAGLINKTVPVDNVVSEFLNFGDVKLSDVVALQKDKVEAVASQLENVPQTLDNTDGVKKLELVTLGMARMRDAYMKISDFPNLQTPDDYFSEAGSMKNDNANDYAVFKTAATNITKALKNIEELEKVSTVDDENYGSLFSYIKFLSSCLGSMKTAVSSFESIVQVLESFKKLNDGALLRPVEQVLGVLAIHKSLTRSTTSNAPRIGTNVETTLKLSPILSSAQPQLTLLNGLISSRINPTSVKRQFTSGFPNGASDLKSLSKDIRDPLLESSIDGRKDFGRLSEGLKPLTDMSAKLDALDGKLKSFTTSEVLQSTRNVAELGSLMSGLTVTSDQATSVVNLFDSNFPQAVPDEVVKPAETLIANARKIEGEVKSIRASLKTFPQVPNVISEVQEVLGKLQVGASLDEVEGIIKDFRGKQEQVKEVVAFLKSFQTTLQSAPNPLDVKAAAEVIHNSEATLKTFLDDTKKIVQANLETLKSTSEPVDSVVKAIRASQIFRDFKGEDVKNIRTSIGTITSSIGGIKELQKTSTDMKKTEEVMELVAFKDARNTSETLGSAASAISTMAKLKGMDMTVIRNPTAFDTELGKVKDPLKKAEILEKWGDHTAFMASLDTTLGQIDNFGAKMSVDKDLRKLGAHLNASKTVSDVKQSISVKSEAVGILILETPDANAKNELATLKAQLDSIAALDLQFSNHHAAFPAVPGALKALFDFLSHFVTPRMTAAQAAAAAAAAKRTDFFMYIVIGCGLLGLLVLLGVAFMQYYKNTVKSWPQIEKCMEKNYFGRVPDAVGHARSMMNEMEKEAGELKTKKADPMKMRYGNLEVLEASAVEMPDGRFINANQIKSLSGAVFIATQGPLEERWSEDKKEKEKDDTREDFLDMVMAKDSDHVVQLCAWIEEKEDADIRDGRLRREADEDAEIEKMDDPIMKGTERAIVAERRESERLSRLVDKAGRYYKDKVGESMVIGKYTVTTDSMNKVEGGIEEREVTLSDSKNKTKKSITVHFHPDWPDHSVPKHFWPVIKLMKRVNESKKPIIVHCSAGVGRTVAFIGIDVIASDIERHPFKRIVQMFIKLRQFRHRGMQTVVQCFFCFICALGLLILKHSKTNDAKVMALFDKYCAVFNEAVPVFNKEDQEEKLRLKRVEFQKLVDRKMAEKKNKKKEEPVKKPVEPKPESNPPDSVIIVDLTGPMEPVKGGAEKRGAGGADHVAIQIDENLPEA